MERQMKALLINAPLYMQGIYKSFSPPLGLLYLAAVLEKEQIEVKVIDGDQEEDIYNCLKKTIVNYQPDLVGISALSLTFAAAVKIGKFVKDIHPGSLLFMGGYHPTFHAQEILENYLFVDLVIRGEAEETILEIANEQDLSSISGLTYRKNGQIIHNSERPLIDDLDKLPFPARHQIKKYKYTYASAFRWSDPRRYWWTDLQRFASIVTSRGCPFQCIYCSNSVFAKKFRARSANNVFRELEGLVREGWDRFFFVDDNFTAYPKRVIDLCNRILDLGREVKWFCMGRVDTASEELYELMARAGCRLILFGVESGSQRILDYYNKRTTVAQAREALRLAKKSGMDVMASLIIGAPIETFDDIKETLKLIKSEDIDFIEVNNLAVLPGTWLWNKSAEAGRINPETDWERILYTRDFYKHLSSEVMKRWSRYLYYSFYLRPGYIFRQLGRTISNRIEINWGK
jgi:anaerobic magnesium-protoporphyrin IX monomethyl ester cyclase